MHRRLVDFLEKNNIIYEHQYGFQKNKSTSSAILDLYSQLIESIENKKFACSIFLDFAKAFDTVNHEILLKKLEYYGIRGVANKWFRSYLTNRSQNVKIGGIYSETNCISHGVPQGSILGPTLFLLYINDINVSSKKLKFLLFADDTSTVFTHDNLKTNEETYNTELRYVHDWLNANKLSLNIKKSNMVIFQTPQKKKNLDIQIKINNTVIEEHSYTKYLGILLDNKLTWKPSSVYINLKFSKGLVSRKIILGDFEPKTNLLRYVRSRE